MSQNFCWRSGISLLQFGDSLSPNCLVSVGKIKALHIPQVARRKTCRARECFLQVARNSVNHRLSPPEDLLPFDNPAPDVPVEQDQVSVRALAAEMRAAMTRAFKPSMNCRYSRVVNIAESETVFIRPGLSAKFPPPFPASRTRPASLLPASAAGSGRNICPAGSHS